MWPKFPPAWLEPWTLWRLQGQKGPRPQSPVPIPKWAWCWLSWVTWKRGTGAKARPSCAPAKIPAWTWPILERLNAAMKPKPPDPETQVARWTWVECHGYYDPRQAEIGRMLDDAQRWHNWPNCVPMVGIDGNWPIWKYPELAGRQLWSAWRWEQIVDFAQLSLYQGGYLWVADGFEAGTGNVDKLIENLRAMRAHGAFLQAGHAHREHATALRDANFDVQCWASCTQISQADLRAALDELRPSRFIGQVEGVAEREAMAAYIHDGVFGGVPWDCVISGWGDFQAL